VELRGAVAVVTGAAGGIGVATVAALRGRGVTVVAADRDRERLRLACAATGATPFDCDVRDPAHAAELVSFTEHTHGRVDIVVANAGIGHAGDFPAMPTARLVDVVDVNVRAPLLLARAALPAMVERRTGTVVLVTSIAGSLLVPRESVYSATKAALEAFAVPLREELRGTRVHVSTVVPSVVATAFWEGRGEPYQRSWPRPVSAERVAGAIVEAVEAGRTRVVVPTWFLLPMHVHRLAPRLYRAVSRRFG
jgi:short-subunit dehydrogenase